MEKLDILCFQTKGVSMDPLIKEGDLVFVQPIIKKTDIKLGDILAYKNKDTKENIVHRLIEIRNLKGKFDYILQGDFTDEVDLVVSFEDILGKVIFLKRSEQIINLENSCDLLLKSIWNYLPVFKGLCLFLLKRRSIGLKLNFTFNPKFLISSPEKSLVTVRDKFGQKEEIDFYSQNADLGLEEWERIIVKEYLRKDTSILHLGCGAGREALALAKLGFKVTAIDIVPEMIKKAQEKAREQGVEIRFELMSASDIDFARHTFDYCLFDRYLYSFIPSRALRIKTLLRIKRCLKPEGLIFFGAYVGGKFKFFTIFYGFFRKILNIIFPSYFLEPGDIWIRTVSPVSKTNSMCFCHIFSNIKEIEKELRSAGLKLIKSKIGKESIFVASSLFEYSHIKTNRKKEDNFIIELIAEKDISNNQEILKKAKRPDMDWEYILDKVKEELVFYPYYHKISFLDRQYNFLSERLRQNLKNTYYTEMTKSIYFTQYLNELLGYLDKLSIKILLIKGASTDKLIYSDGYLRPRSDVDLVVKEEDIFKLDKAIKEKGYLYFQELQDYPIPEHLNSRYYLYNDGFYPALHIHLNLINNLFLLIMDRNKINMNKVWQESVLFSNYQNIYSLSLEMQIIFLCEHSLKHNYERWVFLWEISRLIQNYQKMIDWDKLVSLSKEFNLERILYFSLYLAKEIFYIEIPEKVFLNVKPEKGLSYLERIFLNSVLKGAHRKRLIYYSVYLSTQENLEGKLRFLFRSLFPPQLTGRGYWERIKRAYLCLFKEFNTALRCLPFLLY